MDAETRRQVIDRAGRRCEYCRLHEAHQPLVSFHVEHIVARQHGGKDSPQNLALACQRCNLRKGTNLTGLDPLTEGVIRLFHPRQDRWEEHFELRDGQIMGLSAVGRATVALLQMNSPDRVELRLEMLALRLWSDRQGCSFERGVWFETAVASLTTILRRKRATVHPADHFRKTRAAAEIHRGAPGIKQDQERIKW